METKEQPTTHRCKKLHELPPVVADWQQKAWCPDCDYYCDGQCRRSGGEAECPFASDALPLREVRAETPDSRPGDVLATEPFPAPQGPPRLQALGQDVKLRIADRTGRRIRALVIELTERELIVRGTATCYYLKQLALHAALDALRSDSETAVALRFEVGVVPPAAPPDPG